MAEPIEKRIERELRNFEFETAIYILYACESGSRCWGFASKDSDYDVRFIYTHEPEYYLTNNLHLGPDTLEIPTKHPLDMNGWDLAKALKLFRKCNPPLYEWLRSPIVYANHEKFVNRLRPLMKDYYNYTAMCYHYLHMADGNNRQYLQGSEVRIKKYLYVLRPLLSVLWLMKHDVPPPLDFRNLVGLTLGGRMELLDAIESLVTYKEQGAEKMTGPRIDIISDFLDEELARLKDIHFSSPKIEESWEPLQKLFIDTLRLTYGEEY